MALLPLWLARRHGRSMLPGLGVAATGGLPRFTEARMFPVRAGSLHMLRLNGYRRDMSLTRCRFS